ncbi:COG3650 family protein [Vibrio nomapromontoriensis]|uniref:COG3650 family protein n=1 Tax=Vibrio nomapromontoriensis TaxID=2910246 RepID=UPI003D11165D
MKMSRLSFAVPLVLILQACSSFNTTSNESSTTPLKAELSRPETITPQSYVLRGQAIVGHESRTIQPCGSTQQYWLELPKEAREAAEKLSRTPYQALYAEVIGHLEAPSHRGFDSDYTGRFVVKQVNLITAENPNRCDQPLRPTQVLGNEPFWNLKFNTSKMAQFSQMGNDPQTLELESKQITQNTRRYEFDDANLTMTSKLCNDTMSDSVYGWSAALVMDDQPRQGCATVSNRDRTLSWVNTYTAQSTENTGFTVSMTLNADHTAITRYDYADQSPATEERGFWQQLNDQQVQVVMTRHQQQYLVSQRIFTQEEGSLVATEEKVGNILYPISNGGLRLYKSQ